MSHRYHQYLTEVTERIQSTDSIIPAQRAAYKKGFSFSGLPFGEQLPIWDYIWHQPATYRHKLYAIFYLEDHMKKTAHHEKLWETSVKWQELVDDWGLCDSLSKIYTKIMETQPELVYTTLQNWNGDANLWKRRQSLVSLLYYSRTKKIHLPSESVSPMVATLLTDKEYYVQKGVGWTLRELNNVYPEATYKFLQENIKQISAIAFTIAIEKLSAEAKNGLKAIRR